MESEKFKEVKKALECCATDLLINNCPKCPYDDNPSCREVLLYNVLTYINELESENERLLDQRNKTYNIWVKDTKKLKDQIAELENNYQNVCVLLTAKNEQIVDLTKDNEKLKTSEFNSCQELDNASIQIHSLEARIAELENGIAKSMLGCEFLPECTNEKLKQFAERLKDRKAIYHNNYFEPYFSCFDIDEALKECLDENN